MRRVAYGPDPSQFGDLHLPAPSAATPPVVVVVHGGYWRSAYGLELGTPLAADLVQHGVAAWNIEYRRVGNGGGWPYTLQDVATAVDALTGKDFPVDRSRVVVLGHSAGGQLAAWLSGRHKLRQGQVGADPAVRPIGYVAQAGVLDLAAAFDQGLGTGAVQAFLGGSPERYPDRYADASPYQLLPLGVPGTLVHGLDDDTVPIDQSDRYHAQATRLGDQVEEVRLPGVEHFMLIDPTTAAWATCRTAVLSHLAR